MTFWKKLKSFLTPFVKSTSISASIAVLEKNKDSLTKEQKDKIKEIL